MWEHLLERATTATTVIAVGGLASPWWLPSLAGVSQGLAVVLQGLGIAWLLIQIYYKVTHSGRDKPPRE